MFSKLLSLIWDYVIAYLNNTRSFTSFDEAIKSAGSYENQEVVDLVAKKTLILRKKRKINTGNKQFLQNFYVLSTLFNKLTKPYTVVDYGGALGTLYYEMESELKKFIKKWIIVETPMMVKRGKNKFQTKYLKFYDDYAIIRKLNTDSMVLIIQGTIQYVPNPVDLLMKVFSLKIKYIYICRSSFLLNSTRKIISIQASSLAEHGPGNSVSVKHSIVKNPVTYVPLKVLLESAKTNGYTIMHEFNEELMKTIFIDNQKFIIQQKGYLFYFK